MKKIFSVLSVIAYLLVVMIILKFISTVVTNHSSCALYCASALVVSVIVLSLARIVITVIQNDRQDYDPDDSNFFKSDSNS